MEYNISDLIFMKNIRLVVVLVEASLILTISYIIYTIFQIDASPLMIIKIIACLFLTAFIYQTYVALYYVSKFINEIREYIEANKTT